MWRSGQRSACAVVATRWQHRQRTAARKTMAASGQAALKSSYTEQYRRSLETPDEFWAEAAGDIQWFKTWDRVLDHSHSSTHRWFTGGQMNTCYNALDVHVENGRGDAVALYYDSPVTSTKRQFTFKELQQKG
ncbi:TPA: hypothetical protein N0F65_012665 [Lagenidium giganteum]|uniref:Acetyl-coenzyme A synthetase N-terminal domain-containing protein n=1 Tax=Lagenidium giganteum TaxID=4803 RepID=A0AAV2YJE0_9STRA|nr:TPA: hypothetical protein N0F65_012665 [Lagenidium giganteum]